MKFTLRELIFWTLLIGALVGSIVLEYRKVSAENARINALFDQEVKK